MTVVEAEHAAAEPEVPDLEEPVPEEPTSDGEALTEALALADVQPQPDLPAVPGDDEWRAIASMARVLADSDLVPSALRRKPHDVALILLTGRELGIAPTAALRSCYVVDGKVTLAPALKQAIVRERGLGRVMPAPGNNADEATWIAYEPGDAGWSEVARYTLRREDLVDAKAGKMNLLDKDNWKSYPARMLSARCRGWLIDDVWPEAAFGLYSPDEVGAFTDEDGQPIDVASYENVPDGFRRETAPAEVISAEDAAALVARIQAMPPTAVETVYERWLQAKSHGDPLGKIEEGMAAAKFRMASSLVAGVESMVRSGKFGDEGPTEGSAVYCGACGEVEKADGSCGCAPEEPGQPTLEDAADPNPEAIPGGEPM